MTLQYIACAQNDNKGEQITRNFLMSTLDQSNGVLLGNYHLPEKNSTRECDFVLFNRQGIWILEVKNWRGSIIIDQVKWQRNDGLIQHSPLISVATKAKILARILEQAGFKNISIVGLVVLAQANAKLQNSDNITLREPREDKIFRLDDRLIRALTGRNYLSDNTNRELSMGLINRIVTMLLPRAVDPRQEYIGDSYRILYDLGLGPEEIFHAYQAVHVRMPGRYARAKKYYTTSAFSTKDLADALSRFQRDMEALARIGEHRNIVQVYDYLPDRDSSDIHWLLLEWVKGISLQDRLETGPQIPFQEQLHILTGILDALDCCHNRGILHRNITPACVYLANDGAAKLGDFDFARIPESPLTLTFTDKPFPVKANRYMAPELRANARDASVCSDLYAVAAIWYDMLARPEPREKIDFARLEEIKLSSDARDLLVRLLAPEAKDRPKNARAVKRWLEQV